MRLRPMICEICGGAEFVEKNGVLVCIHCDANYPKHIEESEEAKEARILRISRLDDAEKELRMSPPHFDIAEDKFLELIRQYPEWSVGYWGVVRAKYGIKYELDMDGKAIPSCYKSSYEDFRNDTYFKKAIEFAETEEIKVKYQSEADRIAQTCKEWRETASKFDYDIFISFKASENGEETRDAREMQNLYTYLTEQGYKVFFSPVSMRSIVGKADWDAYIFNALEKAKIMILYGSNVEYFTTTWIENEWTRYLRMVERGMKNADSLIVAYENFDANSLPRQLRKLQAINAGDRMFYITLIKRISEILSNIQKNHTRELDKNKTITKQKVECPVCKTNCEGVTVCPTCGFEQLNVHFADNSEAAKWYQEVVLPYKNNYEKSNVLQPIDWIEFFKRNATAKRLIEYSIPVAIKRRSKLDFSKTSNDESDFEYYKDATLEHIAIVSKNDIIRKHFVEMVEQLYLQTVNFSRTASPAVERASELAAVLTNLQNGGALIFEISSKIKKDVVKVFSSALNENALDITIGKGPGARIVRIDLPAFTTIFVADTIDAIPTEIANTLGSIIEVDLEKSELNEIQIREIAPMYDVQLTKCTLDIVKEYVAQNAVKNIKSILKYISDYLYLHTEITQPLSEEEMRKVLDSTN